LADFAVLQQWKSRQQFSERRVMERRNGCRLRGGVGGLALCLAALFSSRTAIVSATDNVAGNLINFNNDGAWSWYMDERAVVDSTSGTLLVASNASSSVIYPTGHARGVDDVVTYNLATGSRNLTQLSANNALSVDDHDDAGLLVLPDGRYLAMYSNHGNQGGGDYLTRYRISTNPHDSSSWTAEKQFDWSTVAGWNTDPYANNRVSYNNLFYLSAENQVYDFSRATHQAMNTLKINPPADPITNPTGWTASWDGQFESSSIPGYGQGYFKFASNGVDKIFFISTETHPRGYNTSIYAGYISGGKTYKMDGTLMDSDISDNAESNPSAVVPDIGTFTPVLASQSEATNNRTHEWTTDLALDSSGNPYGLITARGGATSAIIGTPPGNNYTDHRLWYTRYDGTQWHSYEVARMGAQLYGSEEDYTGNGSVVPGDPNTIYVSTPYDPRDPTGATVTPKHEIYKGVTANGGADFTWTAITSNSSVDNLRPIVPTWDSTHSALLWFRGTYTSAQNIDAAVVGLVDKHVDEQVGLVHYVDATTGTGGNTTLSTGGAVTGWTTSTTTGNGGSVLQATSNVTSLKTTLTDLADGKYDLFGFFWADTTNDLRVQFGLTASAMQLYRRNGTQQAEAAQFDTAETLSGGGLSLYRAYLGRVSVIGGSPVSAIIDDLATGTTTRAMYDGLGYALVSLAGDYNHDGIVDAADYAVWRGTYGQSVAAGTAADGNNDGFIDQGDYDMWTNNFGHGGAGAGGGAATVPEPGSGLLIIFGGLMLAAGRRKRKSVPEAY
jgi:hypothetical protein